MLVAYVSAIVTVVTNNLHFDSSLISLQWNPSIPDTIGNQTFVRYSEVSLTQGFPVYLQ